MTTKCFCDRCHDEGAGRVTCGAAASMPIKIDRIGPKFDADLCQVCADRVFGILQQAYTAGMQMS